EHETMKLGADTVRSVAPEILRPRRLGHLLICLPVDHFVKADKAFAVVDQRPEAHVKLRLPHFEMRALALLRLTDRLLEAAHQLLEGRDRRDAIEILDGKNGSLDRAQLAAQHFAKQLVDKIIRNDAGARDRIAAAGIGEEKREMTVIEGDKY